MAYSPEVERWRSLVAKYFKPQDVDKALYVIQGESGGRETVAGDSGRSVGLFQMNIDRGLGVGSTIAQLKDPEYNIKLAAQAVYGGSGWRPWGEGTENMKPWNGKTGKFGALGNNPYDRTRAKPAEEGGQPPSTGNFPSGIEGILQQAVQDIFGRTPLPKSMQARFQPYGLQTYADYFKFLGTNQGKLEQQYGKLKEEESGYILRGEPVPEGLRKQLTDISNFMTNSSGLDLGLEETVDPLERYLAQMDSLSRLHGTAVQAGFMKSGAANDRMQRYLELLPYMNDYEYTPGFEPGGIIGNMLGAGGGMDPERFRTQKVNVPSPDSITEAADTGYQGMLNAILGVIGSAPTEEASGPGMESSPWGSGFEPPMWSSEGGALPMGGPGGTPTANPWAFDPSQTPGPSQWDWDSQRMSTSAPSPGGSSGWDIPGLQNFMSDNATNIGLSALSGNPVTQPFASGAQLGLASRNQAPDWLTGPLATAGEGTQDFAEQVKKIFEKVFGRKLYGWGP